MTKLLTHILKRIDSRHLAKLWSFYRSSFKDDSNCLQFIYDALSNEPANDGLIYHEFEEESGNYASTKNNAIHDSAFIPRRMLNTVERLVMAGRDMEQIRSGKDIFKIVYIVTCVETLQKLRQQQGSKKQLLFSFFVDFTSDDDKQFIADNFTHNDDEIITEKEDSFMQFVGMLNEYRNCATHEGEYWNFCFNNNANDYPILLSLNIDLEKYSPNNKKEHCFRTTISYRQFEAIFIRSCVNFIKNYISSQNSAFNQQHVEMQTTN